MDVHQAPTLRSDPQTAIAIAEQPANLESPKRGRERIQFLRFPVHQLCDGAMQRDQDRAVIGSRQTSGDGGLDCQRIEFGWTGLPAPQAVRRLRPQITLGVLPEAVDSSAKTAILAVTSVAAILNRAHSAVGRRVPARPNGAFTILIESENTLSGKLGVPGQLTLFPACQPS